MYFGLFEKEEDVCKEFAIGSVDGAIIFAAYEYEDYSGQADVIFYKNGKFYHVSGSHCSCYGLEELWSPEEMPVDALRHIITKGTLFRGHHESLLRAIEVMESLDLTNASQDAVKVAARLAWI